MKSFKTRYGITVVEDPNMKSGEAILVPYKAGEYTDKGSFYAFLYR